MRIIGVKNSPFSSKMVSQYSKDEGIRLEWSGTTFAHYCVMNQRVLLLKKHLKILLYQLCEETEANLTDEVESLLWELNDDINKLKAELRSRRLVN